MPGWHLVQLDIHLPPSNSAARCWLGENKLRAEEARVARTSKLSAQGEEKGISL